MTTPERRRAVVLAAGRGERLRPLSDTTPKPLVEVGGRPILRQTIEALGAAGIAEILVVVGHLAEKVRTAVDSWGLDIDVRFRANRDYATTNSVVSFAAAADFVVGQPFVLVDGDVAVDPALLAVAVGVRHDAVVVDVTRAAVADMGVQCRGGRVWHLAKDLVPEDSHGELIGVSSFTAEGGLELLAEIDRYLTQGRTDVWYELPLRDLAKRYVIRPVATEADRWFEIDSAADLADVRSRFDAGELAWFAHRVGPGPARP